jgi:hypothetical protein
MDERRHKSTEDRGLHTFRTEIPNTVVRGIRSRGLSIYAKWLYVYLKSVVGDDGEGFRSTTTIANEAGMSRGQVSAAKQELLRHGLISIKPGRNPRRNPDVVRIKNIWIANFEEFSVQDMNSVQDNEPGASQGDDVGSVQGMNSRDTECSGYEHSVQDMNTSVHHMNQRRSLEEDPSKKETPPIVPPGDMAMEEPKGTAKAKAKESTGKVMTAQAVHILEYMNRVHGRTLENVSQIIALLKSKEFVRPITMDDCKLVIDWLQEVERVEDPEAYRKWVNSITPFKPKVFERHLDKARQWHKGGRGQHRQVIRGNKAYIMGE